MPEELQPLSRTRKAPPLATERQRAALDAFGRVAEAARLPIGKAPTRTQYAEHAPRLGITLKVGAIGRAFKTWGNAQQTFERGVLPSTARPVSHRQVFGAHRERTPVEHLALLQEWVSSTGEQRRREYERWRKEHGAALVAAGEPLPLGAQQLLRLFPGLTWDELLTLDLSSDLTEVVRARIEQRLADTPNPLGLVTLPEVAGLLGRTETSVRFSVDQQTDGFPVEVMRLGEPGARLLLIEDVREYARTGRAPTRFVGELQGAAFEAAHVAKLYGVSRTAMIDAKDRKHTPLPAADGKAGHYWYWLRSTISARTTPR